MDGWIFVLLIAAVVVVVAVVAARRPDKLCMTCGTIGQPAYRSTGSIGVALFMWIGGLVLAAVVHWLFLLLPVGHLIARLASSGLRVCAKCGGTSLVPLDTPAAQRYLRENGPKG
jgi:hypothetical protein